eukprot:SAG31_NODE_12570_length_932_cov_0.738295_2_plen_81_part_01
MLSADFYARGKRTASPLFYATNYAAKTAGRTTTSAISKAAVPIDALCNLACEQYPQDDQGAISSEIFLFLANLIHAPADCQ